MSTVVQHRRGNKGEVDNYIPKTGELIWNTETKAIHMGDGVKEGGHNQRHDPRLELKIFQSPTGNLTKIETFTVNASEVYEVRKTSDDSLATIYSDAAGTTEVVQNGTSNVSDSAGVVEFFVEEGEYYIAYNLGQTRFSIGHNTLKGRNDLNAHEALAINTYEDERADKFISRQINYNDRVGASKMVGNTDIVVRSNQRKPKLVILLGQSNAEGRGTTSAAGIANDIVGWRPSVQIWTDSGFADLRVPSTSSDPNQNNDALPGRYGVELAIANYAEVDNEVIHMVKVTDGGTFMGQWLASEDIIPVDGGDPNAPENDGDLSIASPTGGVLDSEAWEKVQDAKVALDALYGSGNYEDVLVMIQGEANGGSATQRPRFKRQRITFNNRWRARLGSTIRIISPQILAFTDDYIYINKLLDEIEYEDKLNYTISNCAYLPTDDGIHLNYKGLCQLGRTVYNEILNPTTKRVNYPSGRVTTKDAVPSLTILDYEDTIIITGTTAMNYTNKSSCKDGRIIRFWRKDAGAGVAIRHLNGDASVYALFSFLSESTRPLAAGEFIKFVGYEGIWHQVIES